MKPFAFVTEYYKGVPNVNECLVFFSSTSIKICAVKDTEGFYIPCVSDACTKELIFQNDCKKFKNPECAIEFIKEKIRSVFECRYI